MATHYGDISMVSGTTYIDIVPICVSLITFYITSQKQTTRTLHCKWIFLDGWKRTGTLFGFVLQITFCLLLSSPHDFTHGFPTDKNVKSNSLSPLTICFSTVTNSRSNVMYIYKTTVPLRSTVQWKDTYSYSSQNIFNNPSLYEYQNLDPVDLELNLKP